MVVVTIDRNARLRLDTMGNIQDLQQRGVRIRSLADNEQTWAQYLDADPDSPESLWGYILAGFAAWVSYQELVSIRRGSKRIEFLYRLNRLSVATSRARCLAFAAASPGLLKVRCRVPNQIAPDER